MKLDLAPQNSLKRGKKHLGLFQSGDKACLVSTKWKSSNFTKLESVTFLSI